MNAALRQAVRRLGREASFQILNGETALAYAIVHYFPGGTKEQYEATMATVHPNRETLPEGQIFHAAGASEGGWTIMAVHDSKESWDRFHDGILIPRLKQGISGGFTTHPQETSFEVHNLQP